MDHSDDSTIDADSLFGSDTGHKELEDAFLTPNNNAVIASRSVPPIPGMFFMPNLLRRELHDRVLHQVSECEYFDLGTERDSHSLEIPESQRSHRNQVMLFSRSLASPWSAKSHGNSRELHQALPEDTEPSDCAGLPGWTIEFIQQLRQLIMAESETRLPLSVKEMLFPGDKLLSRQLILNLYNGAEGLAPHVDLVHRFADGILLCSFGPHGTGTVMDFTHKSHPAEHLFLPSGSVLVLSGEARYDWKHGISARDCDFVYSADGPHRIDKLKRSIRLSITIRSMLPGADVVGE